jgi:hypothetical protein
MNNNRPQLPAGNPKEIFRLFRHKLGFERSEFFMPDMKKKFPKLDLHHLLGSYLGKKMTDFLLVPIPHTVHLEKVEKNKAIYFMLYILMAITYLRNWCVKNGARKKDVELPDLHPETVQKIINVAVDIETKLKSKGDPK